MIENILHIAKQAIEHNKVVTTEGEMLAAGGNQFRSLWLRDFCYSVPALLLLDEKDLVHRQIESYLRHMRSDGLMPRGLDAVDPKTRVLLNTGLRFLPKALKQSSYKYPLKPEYFGEHQTVAFDSNILILKVMAEYSKATGDIQFIEKHLSQIKVIFSFYKSFLQRGLLIQPDFSDWQDSARRSGSIFYSHLLILKVLHDFKDLGFSIGDFLKENDFKARIFEHFYDSKAGLFRNKNEEDQYALESQLWAIEWDLFNEQIKKTDLLNSLKQSSLWHPLAGRPVSSDYPSSEISWTTKAVGLRHYHDQFYWSWLIAEAGRVCHLLNNTESCDKILRELAKVILKYQDIHEIYEFKKDLVPVRRLFYSSEAPFSWGAAKVYEFVSALNTKIG